MKDGNWGMSTRLIHAGEPRPRIGGAAIVPIFQGNVFESEEGAAYGDILYPRLSNSPNHTALHGKLASVAGAEDARVTSSGRSAIATALLAVLGENGHVLSQRTLYGGTHALMHRILPERGGNVTLVDLEDPERWAEALRPNTRVFYVEAISNPLVEVGPLEKVVAFAQKQGLITIVDNTFASPVNFRPAEWGFDLEVHSASKYLNGHSDLIAGAVMGKKKWIARVKETLDILGGSLDAHACFLLHRGVRTLEMRVGKQNASALELARFLEGQPGVERVYYPFLDSSPSRENAGRLLHGGGGVFSFEVRGGAEVAARVTRSLALFVNGPSLGGLESLVTRPATTSHAAMTPEERTSAGISDGLIRIAVGIEDVEDLKRDLVQAIAGALG